MTRPKPIAEFETDPFLVGYQEGVATERERCAKRLEEMSPGYSIHDAAKILRAMKPSK